MSPTRRRYRRTASTSLALALPLAALAACGGGSGGDTSASAGSGKGTITVWAHQGQTSEDTALQNAVKSFNSSQSKIKVELKLIPGNDYTKTITATDASKLPDVMEFDGPTMANFVYNKKLAAIDSVRLRQDPGQRHRRDQGAGRDRTASTTAWACTTPGSASTATRSCWTRPG